MNQNQLRLSARSVWQISRRSFASVVVAFPIIFGAHVGTSNASEPKFVAKLGHLEQSTQPRHRGLEKVAALVKERTKGEVEIKLFPSSQLGNARQMTEGLQFGSIEAVVMPSAFLGGFNPQVSVLDLPYIFPSDRATSSKLRQGMFGQAVLATFKPKGVHALAIWPNGRKSITSNKPLDNLTSLVGQKFRVMDSKILVAQFGAIGATAVPINFTELYTSLQTGLVDGQENPPDTIATMKFYEVQKNLVVTEHGSMEDIILFNVAWWNKLPQNYKEVIASAFKEVSTDVEKLKDEATEAALDTMKAAKVNVRIANEAERSILAKAVADQARAAYVERAGADGLRLLELLDSERRKLGIQ